MLRALPTEIPAGPVAGETVIEVVRGRTIESRHRAHLVVLDPLGRRILATGRHADPILARSALKPIQAAAMVLAGLSLPRNLLALATSSHSGRADQVSSVREILAGHGLSEGDLRCSPSAPLNDELCGVSAGLASAILSSCSAKHAAMLVTCRINGWPLDSYLQSDHPLQQHILETIQLFSGDQVAHQEIDGCGAPTYEISLYGLARCYSRLVLGGPGPGQEVAEAIRQYPLHVAGPGRFATDAMLQVPGLIAKDGAEGICAAVLPDGAALAFKIEDGAYRPSGPLLADLLETLGAGPVKLGVAVTGGSESVGELRVRHHGAIRGPGAGYPWSTANDVAADGPTRRGIR
jgi:L-asparaginase II